MALIKFERLTAPTGSVNFSRNPSYGSGEPYKFRQPKDMSDGGDLYSYDKGVVEDLFELTWNSLPDTDWTNLDNFIRNVAVGIKNSFTYYDKDSNTYTVVLESEDVDFRPVRYNRYSGTLVLRKIG